MMNGRLLLAFALIGMVTSGCDRSADAPTAVQATPTAPGSLTTNAAPTDARQTEITTEVVSWDQVQEIVQSHQGKVVILDLWSTYCPPCIKELPGLVKLQEKYPADVVALTLNLNFNGLGTPDDEREEIVRVLKDVGSNGRNLVSSEADEALYKRIGLASVPVVYVYDRSGKLAKQFDNEKGEYPGEGFNYEQNIAPLVDSLVEKK